MCTTKYNIVTVIVFLTITGCGGLKVGLDDETLDAVECATGQNNCDDATQNASSDSSDDEIEHTANYEGSNSDDETTGGGIEVIEPDGYNESEDRFFMGTFSEGSNSAIYSYSSQNCANQYNFPNVIRGYSHNMRTRFWVPLLHQLKLVYRKPYVTRHTFASIMLSEGQPSAWVAHTMGDNLQTVLRHYAQYIPTAYKSEFMKPIQYGELFGVAHVA